MNSRERVLASLNHQAPDVAPVDLGASMCSGIHVKMVEALREHYGLEKRPVRVIDTFQMLGEIEDDLAEVIGVDCAPLFGPRDMFGDDVTREHEQRTPWGQEVICSVDVDLTPAADGKVYVYPMGDRNLPASGMMPSEGYFFDAIERPEGELDDDELNVEDNLEEFQPISDEVVSYFAEQAARQHATGKAVVASFPGSGLGDVAFLPGPGLAHPKGVRTVAEWYISLAARQDYVAEMFEREITVAIENFKRLWAACGENVDVAFTCGADLATQTSQFFSVDTFNELYLPSYKRLNDWIHANTTWKVMKHTDGALRPLLPGIVEGGIDILNPIQLNATGMDAGWLKENYGDKLTFWGAGVDTQKELAFGTPDEVKAQVKELYGILSVGGGWVASSVHNVQANMPVENVVAFIDTLNQLRGRD